MRSKLWYWFLPVLLACVWCGESTAVEPADVLGDHMVLQRNKPAPVWGTAEAGEKITVSFADQTKTAIADKSGQWMVRLDPLAASTTPRELTIKGASETVTIKDVLVGDVWIAGGQSNMGRDVNRSWRPNDQRMDYPHIRFLKVASPGSKYPNSKLALPAEPPRKEPYTAPNKWHVCTLKSTPECCAVGFFFAERVYKETGIPQGLLWNAWAGSTAREWIPGFGWSLRSELEATARVVDSWYPGTSGGRAAYTEAVDNIDTWRDKAEDAVRKEHPFPFPQPMLPEPDDSQGKGRGTTILYNGRVHPLVPYAIKGILWYQGESDYANRGYVPQIEAMVESWRKLFAAPGKKPADLPFYFVQMQRSGSYMSPDIRDHQFESYFTIPNAGMAVLMDLDVQLHPGNKYDAGRRLALWALAKDYGKDVIYSGPLYKSRRGEGNRVIVEFSYTHGGLMIGRKNKLEPVEKLPDGKLVNLEITADGRKWSPAQSHIDGDKLIVWADGVDKPTDVRYCFKSIAEEPFLYNKANLPAAQFNTTTDYTARNNLPPKTETTKQSPSRPDASTRARVQLSAVFGDNCVLQRGVNVPVWGRAEPGEKIEVIFAGQTRSTTADRFGCWRVELEAMGASSRGRPLVVKGPENTIQINDVYMGDVWLYLSQSWHLGGPEELRVDSDSIPPICTNASAGVWEHQHHSQRPQAGSGDGVRWGVYKTPGRYFRNDPYYLGLGLAKNTGVPVGVLACGASTLESMTPPEGFAAFEDELGETAATVATWVPRTRRGQQAYLKTLKEIDQWIGRTRTTLTQSDITYKDFRQPPQLPGPTQYLRGPTTQYNNVVHRFTPAAIRGIIIQPKVYNVGDPQYLVKARALIVGLREAFGSRDLPVCFVQMHSPDRYELKETENADDWLRMRDGQNQLAQIPNTTVIATYDLRSTTRSDPDIGLRAAQWAAAVVNNKTVRTGPVFKRHRVDGRSIVIEFDNVAAGLMAGRAESAKPVKAADDGQLGGFQVAGADGKWQDATAVIKGETVIATCDNVEKPLAVRYAWSPQPRTANLYNREGFAALPFTSR